MVVAYIDRGPLPCLGTSSRIQLVVLVVLGWLVVLVRLVGELVVGMYPPMRAYGIAPPGGLAQG